MLNDQEDYKLFILNDKPSISMNNLDSVHNSLNNSFVDNILIKQQNDNFNEDINDDTINKSITSNLINNEQVFYNELVAYDEKPANLQQWNANLDTNNTESYFYFDKNYLRNDDNSESLLQDSNIVTENNQDNYLINCQNETLFKFGDEEEEMKSCSEISSYLSNFNSNNFQHSHLSNNSIHPHLLHSNLSREYQIHHHPMINLNVYQQNSSHYISNSSANQIQIPHHHLTSIKNERNLHNCQFYNSQNNVMQNYNSFNEPVASSETRINSVNSQRQSINNSQQVDDQINIISQNKQNSQSNTQFNFTNDSNKKSNDVLQTVNTNISYPNIFKPELSKIRKKIHSKKKIITLSEVANVKLEKIKVAKPNGSKIYYFKCALCEYQTNTSQSMKDHLYCIHCRAKNNYKCKFCHQTFGWKNNAQRHMRRKHKIEDQTTKREAIISLI